MGDFTYSAVSEALVQRCRMHSNPPRMFVWEMLYFTAGKFTTREAVMDEFRQFCKQWSYSGRHSREKVFAELRREFPSVKEGWKKGERGFIDIELYESRLHSSFLELVIRKRNETIQQAEQATKAAEKARVVAERAANSAACSESTAKNAGTAGAVKRRILKAISMKTVALAAEVESADQVESPSASEDKATQAEIEQLVREMRVDED